MGLLDWLTEGLGTLGSGSGMPQTNPMGDASGPSGGYPAAPMPPVQQTGSDAFPIQEPRPTQVQPSLHGNGAPIPLPADRPPEADLPSPPMLSIAQRLFGQTPPGIDPMTQGGLPTPYDPQATPLQGPIPLPATRQTPFAAGTDPMTAGNPPVPLPMPRPGDAPAVSPSRPMFRPPGDKSAILPPSAAEPGATDVSSANRGQPPAGVPGQNWLGRALGIEPGKAGDIGREFAGSLGKGLSAAAAGAHLPGGAAFAAGAGGAFTGGEDVRKELTKEQDRYLTRAIAFANAGNAKAASESLQRLRDLQGKQIEQNMANGGKATGINSKEQIYLGAIRATNGDERIKTARDTARETVKMYGADSPQGKAAVENVTKLSEQIRGEHMKRLGLDPKDAKEFENKPGYSEQNPMKFPKADAAAKAAFEALPEGAYFINPVNGRVKIKQSRTAAAGAAPEPAAPVVTDPAQARGTTGAPAVAAAPAYDLTDDDEE